MNQEVISKLRAPFPFEAVEAKIQVTSKENGTGMAVFYLDSRAIQNRLDEVLGHFNWKNQYLAWQNNAQLCGIAVFNAERNEWVGKFDGAECSDIEPIKGGLSDSFKRAACMWGIGRYLYEIEGVWVEVEQRGKGAYIKSTQQGKLKAAYDTAVNKIFGTGGNIPIANPPIKNNQPANTQPKQQQPAPTAQQNQGGTQSPSSPKNANAKPPQSSPSQPSGDKQSTKSNVIPMQNFKIRGIKNAGKESKLLELCSQDGELISAYIRNLEKGIAVGTQLRNVQLEEKADSSRKYNLLIGYELAEAA
ncbi:MAG: hypothetical protein FWG87_01610 [Defluviitaleaceae bacterium]|nr:hypothetical protein [Defluviitaleaceae bacterium]